MIKGEDGTKNTANHHLLNTWMMSFFALFSEHEFALRMPSVMGFALYGIFTLRIIRSQTPEVQWLFAVPLLFLNNYLLDFFSLARGYGLSMGLMAVSLYYLMNVPLQFRRNAMVSLITSALATLANLNLLNFFIAGLLILSFFYLRLDRTEQKRLFSQVLVVLVVVSSFLAWLVMRLLMLKELGQLYYGTESITHGIDSLFINSLDLSVVPDFFLQFIHYLIPISLASALVLILRKRETEKDLILFLLLALMFLGLFSEHFMFDALYPLNRTFIYFLPLLGLFWSVLADKFINWVKMPVRLTVAVLAGCVALPVSYQFIHRINPDQTIEWGYDAGTKACSETLAHLSQDKKTVLLHHWLFGPALRYYKESRQLNYELEILKENTEAPDTDYLYTFCDDTLAKRPGWHSIFVRADANTCLFNKAQH